MKRRLTVLILALTLIIAISAVPTIYAEGMNIENYVAIKRVTTPNRTIDITNANKSIDMFVGESIDVSADLCIYKNKIIDQDSLIVDYRLDEDVFDITKSNEQTPESGLAWLRRETFTITAKSAALGKQFVVEYMDEGTPLFNSITINVYEKDVSAMTMELRPNVTTLKTNQTVDFDLLINGSDTLSVSDPLTYNVGGVVLDTLEGYKTPETAGTLDVVITMGDKTFETKLDVAAASKLTAVTAERESYGYLLKNKTGKIYIYVTKDSYPNIVLTNPSNAVSLVNVAKVDSDKEDLDKYELNISLLAPAKNENILISADDEYYVAKLNIIDTVTSVAIAPESTKFESGKVSKFHIVVNGVKDVETDVLWTINGVEQSNHSNVLEYKAISDSAITVSAKVEEILGEYSYNISTDKGSIILTVILSIVVIIICIPILIALKKHSKPDLKAMITKDNNNVIKDLAKLKDDTEEGEKILKKALKINAVIARSEKRAQQESFECENKAFNVALSALTEAKELMSSLLQTYKNNPKDVNINIIDNIILSLENANKTIAKVKDNE